MHDYANILWPVLCASGKDRCQFIAVRKAAWDFTFRGRVLRGACSVLLLCSIWFVSSELRVDRTPKFVFALSIQTRAEDENGVTVEGKVEALGGKPA
jgi:hypothetical protein